MLPALTREHDIAVCTSSLPGIDHSLPEDGNEFSHVSMAKAAEAEAVPKTWDSSKLADLAATAMGATWRARGRSWPATKLPTASTNSSGEPRMKLGVGDSAMTLEGLDVSAIAVPYDAAKQRYRQHRIRTETFEQPEVGPVWWSDGEEVSILFPAQKYHPSN
ncbi:hypothetical protein ACFYYL_38005 [Actinomadura geliboluensis]|uniref:hypothetical protein n=1 Tax=Actinomadura geliboluensis TaxID=882440 RepID=UPI003682F337